MTVNERFVKLITYISFVYFVFGSSDDNSKSDDVNDDVNDGDIAGDIDDNSGDDGRSRNDTNEGGKFKSRQKVRKPRNRRKRYTGKRIWKRRKQK